MTLNEKIPSSSQFIYSMTLDHHVDKNNAFPYLMALHLLSHDDYKQCANEKFIKDKKK